MQNRYWPRGELPLDGKDCRRLMLTQRRALLAKMLPADGIIRLSPELPSQPAALMEQARAAGLEGIIAKKRDSFYEEGERSGSWVKWKAEQSETFIIGGYVPNGSTFDELIIGQPEGNRLRYVARVKAGFVPATRRAVMDAVKGQRIEQCPFYNLPEPKSARWGKGLTADETRKCRWVAATVKVRVGFVEWTEAKHLRHSRFLSLA